MEKQAKRTMTLTTATILTMTINSLPAVAEDVIHHASQHIAHAAYTEHYPPQPPAACAAACGSFLFLALALLVINIAMMVWIAKDSKNRGMSSSVGWVILTAITGIIGLVVYLFSRPGGTLVTCGNCRNKKLHFLNTCPHCGQATNNQKTQ